MQPQLGFNGKTWDCLYPSRAGGWAAAAVKKLTGVGCQDFDDPARKRPSNPRCSRAAGKHHKI